MPNSTPMRESLRDKPAKAARAAGRRIIGPRIRYDRVAPVYDLIDLAEHIYKGRVRGRLFEGLSGRILDAGFGTGRNIPHYPAGSSVVAMDISPGMLVQARRRVNGGAAPTALVAMDVVKMAFPDGYFDSAVAAFMMTSLDESLQAPALAELARVCRPGGEIRILDYRLTDHPLLQRGMKLWTRWERMLYGCDYDRRTDSYLPEAGLELVRDERLVGDFVRLLTARRP